MKKTLFWTIFGLSLLSLSAGFLSAAERQTLATRVPATAVQLPRVALLPATDRLQLAIGLPFRDQGNLTNLLRQIYAVGNTNFHRYLTPVQFAQRFGPVDQDYQAVLNYVKSNHLEVVQEYGNHALVDVAGSVADIQKMFRVTLGLYRHPTEDRLFRAPDVAPSIDSGLPIRCVVGLDNYSEPQPNVHVSARHAPGNQAGVKNGSGTNSTYLGVDFRNAYVPGVPFKGAGQVVGLVEYGGYTPADIAEYESLASLPRVPLLPVVLPGARGGGNPCTNCGNFNLEIALDMDMAVAMAPQMAELLVVEGISDVDVLTELASPTNGSGVPLANQISSSYTYSIGADCIPLLWEMAAQGQTFFLCSFDAGSPSNGVQNTATDQNYLTTVGGTELSMNGAGASWQGEVVWGPPYTGTNGGSTGYVETDLAIPDYQLEVNTTANGGSRIYRNVPDVAMCADQIEVVDTITFTNTSQATQTGQIQDADGTSAAAPLWAAFTALVNEAAADQNLPPMGFLNPPLYDIAQGRLYANCFHDITNGANTNNFSPNLYFAGPGYDNCTGLGSPNGLAMINALVAYAGPIWVNFSGACPGNGSYTNPFCTLALATNAVGSGGNIWMIGPNSSSETPSIAKPMKLRAYNGAVVIGQ